MGSWNKCPRATFSIFMGYSFRFWNPVGVSKVVMILMRVEKFIWKRNVERSIPNPLGQFCTNRQKTIVRRFGLLENFFVKIYLNTPNHFPSVLVNRSTKFTTSPSWAPGLIPLYSCLDEVALYTLRNISENNLRNKDIVYDKLNLIIEKNLASRRRSAFNNMANTFQRGITQGARKSF